MECEPDIALFELVLVDKDIWRENVEEIQFTVWPGGYCQ